MAARLGLRGAAWDFWRKGAFLDLDAERGGAAEGVHISACGGTWQAAVFGFAGMRTALQSDVISLAPRLPAAWTRLAFPVLWKGTPVFIDITPEECIVANRGASVMPVIVHGRPATIPAESSMTFRTK
jgi:trehalose/maltose hydrolase-like predicted phosphorylase